MRPVSPPASVIPTMSPGEIRARMELQEAHAAIRRLFGELQQARHLLGVVILDYAGSEVVLPHARLSALLPTLSLEVGDAPGRVRLRVLLDGPILGADGKPLPLFRGEPYTPTAPDDSPQAPAAPPPAPAAPG